MTSAKIASLKKEFLDSDLHGYRITDYIDCGKSAVVFKASQSGNIFAVKVFDPDLIDHYGDGTQGERIQRELSLRGKTHPNLIEIFNGGFEERPTGKFYYVIMEYLPWVNLRVFLPKLLPPMVKGIIRQVAQAAVFLENNGICHRDIKPENIAVSPDGSAAKLLDFGVIRPVADASLTDNVAKCFVATLRYSPPELLFRREKQTTEGYRAITFYQLGGVLHDMIMKRPLFDNFSHPYAALVKAVECEVPNIEYRDSLHQFADLARCCLVKSPEQRLNLVRWDDFLADQATVDTVEAIKQSISKRRALVQASSPQLGSDPNRVIDLRLLASFSGKVASLLRHICSDSDIFPRYQIAEKNADDSNISNVILYFEPDPIWSANHHCYAVLQIRQLDTNVFSISIKAGYSTHLNLESIEIAGGAFHKLWSGQQDSLSLDNTFRDHLMIMVKSFLAIATASGAVNFDE